MYHTQEEALWYLCLSSLVLTQVPDVKFDHACSMCLSPLIITSAIEILLLTIKL